MNDQSNARDDVVAVDRRSPEDTFGLLADDTRIAILQGMAETPDDVVTFSELRERAGNPDSGQFNYHLGKLVGTFVRKTEGESADEDQGEETGKRGYKLTYAGRQIVGAMYAGTYTANATVDPIDLDGECPVCDGRIVAEYADEVVRMYCTDCGDWRNVFSFPPGSLDQFEREELPEAFERWLWQMFRRTIAGFCTTCAGRMTGRLIVDEEADKLGELPAHVEYECERCHSTATANGAIPLTVHPGFEGYLFDHGFDQRIDPSWEIWGALDTPTGRMISDDPPRMAVELGHDGERIVGVVEADASVSSVERERAGTETAE